MSLQDTDAESAAVAVAPRVALADIEAKIAERYDFTAGELLRLRGEALGGTLDKLSVCILVMRNGFAVIGKSAPASPANYDAALGHKFAYEDAIRQLWPLEGYRLRCELATGAL